jgi:hypothetical protein
LKLSKTQTLAGDGAGPGAEVEAGVGAEAAKKGREVCVEHLHRRTELDIATAALLVAPAVVASLVVMAWTSNAMDIADPCRGGSHSPLNRSPGVAHRDTWWSGGQRLLGNSRKLGGRQGQEAELWNNEDNTRDKADGEPDV